MTGVWAVVPAKRFSRAKSRLAGVLDEAGRTRFARDLLERALAALAGSRLAGVLVVTDGDDVAQVASEHGASVLRDEGTGPLADVVDAGLDALRARGASAAVVLMADLPGVSALDIDALVALLVDHDVVVAPDFRRAGTSALALRAPWTLPTSFGLADSFARHSRRSTGSVAVCEREGLAFDVDEPEDWLRWAGRDPGPPGIPSPT